MSAVLQSRWVRALSAPIGAAIAGCALWLVWDAAAPAAPIGRWFFCGVTPVCFAMVGGRRSAAGDVGWLLFPLLALLALSVRDLAWAGSAAVLVSGCGIGLRALGAWPVGAIPGGEPGADRLVAVALAGGRVTAVAALWAVALGDRVWLDGRWLTTDSPPFDGGRLGALLIVAGLAGASLAVAGRWLLATWPIGGRAVIASVGLVVATVVTGVAVAPACALPSARWIEVFGLVRMAWGGREFGPAAGGELLALSAPLVAAGLVLALGGRRGSLPWAMVVGWSVLGVATGLVSPGSATGAAGPSRWFAGEFDLGPDRPLLTLASATPVLVGRMRLVTSASDAAGLEDGAVVATVTVGDGSPLPIRIGFETAEWAYQRSDVRKVVRHQQAPVGCGLVRHDPTHGGFLGQRYVATVALSRPIETTSIRVDWTPPGDARAHLAVFDLSSLP